MLISIAVCAVGLTETFLIIFQLLCTFDNYKQSATAIMYTPEPLHVLCLIIITNCIIVIVIF